MLAYSYAKFSHKNKTIGRIFEAVVSLTLFGMAIAATIVDGADSLYILAAMPVGILFLALFARASKYKQMMHD